MLAKQIADVLRSPEAQADPMGKALAELLRATRCSTGSIHLLEKGVLELKAQVGLPPPLIDKVRHVPIGKGMAGEAARLLKPIKVCNLQTDNAGGVIKDGAKQSGAQGSVALPMMRHGKLAGTLGVATNEARDFTDAEVEELMEVGRVLAEAGPEPT